MSLPIKISIGDFLLNAELNDSSTAAAIAEALPIEGAGNRWGEEIYFVTTVHHDGEPNARAEMDVSELAYWPPGKAFCIFFGPTPASESDEPRAASPCNPIGRITGNCKALTNVSDSAPVRIEVA